MFVPYLSRVILEDANVRSEYVFIDADGPQRATNALYALRTCSAAVVFGATARSAYAESFLQYAYAPFHPDIAGSAEKTVRQARAGGRSHQISPALDFTSEQDDDARSLLAIDLCLQAFQRDSSFPRKSTPRRWYQRLSGRDDIDRILRAIPPLRVLRPIPPSQLTRASRAYGDFLSPSLLDALESDANARNNDTIAAAAYVIEAVTISDREFLDIVGTVRKKNNEQDIDPDATRTSIKWDVSRFSSVYATLPVGRDATRYVTVDTAALERSCMFDLGLPSSFQVMLACVICAGVAGDPLYDDAARRTEQDKRHHRTLADVLKTVRAYYETPLPPMQNPGVRPLTHSLTEVLLSTFLSRVMRMQALQDRDAYAGIEEAGLYRAATKLALDLVGALYARVPGMAASSNDDEDEDHFALALARRSASRFDARVVRAATDTAYPSPASSLVKDYEEYRRAERARAARKNIANARQEQQMLQNNLGDLFGDENVVKQEEGADIPAGPIGDDTAPLPYYRSIERFGQPPAIKLEQDVEIEARAAEPPTELMRGGLAWKGIVQTYLHAWMKMRAADRNGDASLRADESSIRAMGIEQGIARLTGDDDLTKQIVDTVLRVYSTRPTNQTDLERDVRATRAALRSVNVQNDTATALRDESPLAQYGWESTTLGGIEYVPAFCKWLLDCIEAAKTGATNTTVL